MSFYFWFGFQLHIRLHSNLVAGTLRSETRPIHTSSGPMMGLNQDGTSKFIVHTTLSVVRDEFFIWAPRGTILDQAPLAKNDTEYVNESACKIRKFLIIQHAKLEDVCLYDFYDMPWWCVAPALSCSRTFPWREYHRRRPCICHWQPWRWSPSHSKVVVPANIRLSFCGKEDHK